ncbi:unnamed protein product, partial [Rotaria sp. Silwood2]
WLSNSNGKVLRERAS